MNVLHASVAAHEALHEAPAVALDVSSLGVTVRELTRSAAFFQHVLGFERCRTQRVAGPELERLTGLSGVEARVAQLWLGDEKVQLCEYVAAPGRSFPADSRSNDHWFQHAAIIVRDMDEAYARLRRFGVELASVGPQRLPDFNPAAAGIRACYFRDRDGHFLEVLQFPSGKGDCKWHRVGDQLHLGIDHTAIVVRSTASSLKFYRDALGMSIAGTSTNFGPEQERLNNVAGARLQITTLKASSGPGIELLQYLSPETGRPRPSDARPNDLLHWHVSVVVADVAAAIETAKSAGGTLLSTGIAEINSAGDSCVSALVGDPDGHVLELTAQA
jgi:catechol 2,3-dioxygenase-like lactoylglutathione lyase family enzyme